LDGKTGKKTEERDLLSYLFLSLLGCCCGGCRRCRAARSPARTSDRFGRRTDRTDVSSAVDSTSIQSTKSGMSEIDKREREREIEKARERERERERGERGEASLFPSLTSLLFSQQASQPVSSSSPQQTSSSSAQQLQQPQQNAISIKSESGNTQTSNVTGTQSTSSVGGGLMGNSGAPTAMAATPYGLQNCKRDRERKKEREREKRKRGRERKLGWRGKEKGFCFDTLSSLSFS
jgi:hypothetical protein